MSASSGFPSRWAGAEYCYVTTTGRRTGKPHTIEIWFALSGGRVYILSGLSTDWVRNIVASAAVSIRVDDLTLVGIGRVVTDAAELRVARNAVLEKYFDREEGLAEWSEEAAPVAIER